MSPQEQIDDLENRVQFLVNYLNDLGHLENGEFCFPDGEIWEADKT